MKYGKWILTGALVLACCGHDSLSPVEEGPEELFFELGQEIPKSAGSFLYFWQIPSGPQGGDIVRLAVGEEAEPEAYWGPRTGKECSGCHEISPDGNYVAFREGMNFRIVENETNQLLEIPEKLNVAAFISWRPEVNTDPPYQFAYDDGRSIHIASATHGYIRPLEGASEPGTVNRMPSWGPDGKIVFVREALVRPGAAEESWEEAPAAFRGHTVEGPTNLMLVDEGGGEALALPGASHNGVANYYPRFSPNGKWIAFTQSAEAELSSSAPDAVLRLVAANGSGEVRFLSELNSTEPEVGSSYPTWSVDGRFLSFSSNRSGGMGDWDIYIAPIDPATGRDGAALNLARINSPNFEHAGQWSP